jgi:hypothetical protein
MGINRFYVPASDAEPKGLKEIDMRRIGNIVAVAGKNGAGKSRLLEFVQDFSEIRNRSLPMLDEVRTNADTHRNAIASDRRASESRIQNMQNTLHQLERTIEVATNRIFTDNDALHVAVRFVPKALILDDPGRLAPNDLEQRYESMGVADVSQFNRNCLAYVQRLQDLWRDATHHEPDLSTNREEIIESYEALRSIFDTLVGSSLGRKQGRATLFNRTLAEAALSDGQIVLLQLAVSLHAQKARLDNAVILIDELENHLHPSAVIDVLSRLRAVAPLAQIWIATHSVPLLSYILGIEQNALWYMEDGAISHSGKRPERVLESLLGNGERIQQLHDFTGLPSQLAAANYAAECIVPPRTVQSGSGDPQISQIQRMISSLKPHTTITLLDFGAGKGRLLDGLIGEETQQAKDRIDYFAYDQSQSDKSICCATIDSVYGNSSDRYFDSADALFAKHGRKSIDVVVLCNVLHEISPIQWIDLFSKQSLISQSMRDDGYLLVVEDTRIPVGEIAHEFGFLVLDTSHLRVLFRVNSKDIEGKKFVVDDARGDGRLKAHLIAKELVHRVNAKSRNEAIKALQETAVREVTAIRGASQTYSNGQLHGFWSQQLANCFLYLRTNGLS